MPANSQHGREWQVLLPNRSDIGDYPLGQRLELRNPRSVALVEDVDAI